MNFWMYLRYWSFVGLLFVRGFGWFGGVSVLRIFLVMRVRRSLGEA